MRASVFASSVTALVALAGCGTSSPSNTSQTGGAISAGGGVRSGGATGAGGITTASGGSAKGGASATSSAQGAGGITAAGGAVATSSASAKGGATGAGGGTRAAGGVLATGGTSAKGGATGAGGIAAVGGITGAGGAISTGGTSAKGGAGASGGSNNASGGKTGATTESQYQGPCDTLSSGCAEAYGMARAMTAKYTGPLFQLGLAKDKSKTLDIGQTSDRKADLTTWSSFCGGTQSNCVVSRIYAQIHTGPNDLQPAVWKAPWGPDCSAGGYTCAAKFTIESATSLPILTTDAPQEYAIRTNNTENFSTGINGGTKALGLMYNGKPVPNTVYCCGVFGLTHKYDAEDIHGTDFMVALAYGWRDSGGCCIAVNCGASNKYCVGAEEEENNDLYDYGSSPIENALVVTQFDPSKNAVITYLNGTQVLSHSPPKANLNVSTAIHIGGGGDLSQPDPVRMREALVTNNVMTASEVTAMKANVTAFFPMLNFP